MMKYFAIEFSLNERIMGKIPQQKDIIYHSHVYDNPKFIDHFIFEKIEIEPILATAVLDSDAKKTDMLNVSGSIGFSFGFLISEKLKSIFDMFNVYGLQYFQNYILHKNKKYSYWQTRIYKCPYEYINFEKTNFILTDRDSNRNVIKREISFNNIEDFHTFLNEINYPKAITFNKIYFTENMNLDYFSLRYTEGAHNGIVSQKLKEKIEDNCCTGIEFRPIEIGINEWLSKEREKIYGKI